MKLMRAEDRLQTEEFSFTFDQVRYSAEVGKPMGKSSNTTIVIIPGHGRTDLVGGMHFYAVRQFFARMGITTLVWDKKGCGKSEGTYEHHQTVESSAQEAIAAIKAFKDKYGSQSRIGLWGISRAGWICPLMINEDPSIAFWISVSGTDQFDTFRYMVETNLPIEGRTRAETDTLMKQFDHYIRVLRYGGESYEQMVRATDKLFNDPFYLSLGERRVTEEAYIASQDYYKNSDHLFDEQTGLRIMVPDFDRVLNNVNCPTLAILGQLDSQVNWRKTQELYERTIGKKSNKLEVIALPGCNHNIMKCNTGGAREDISAYNGQACDGYYPGMKLWLVEKGFAR
jgi:pimeloyl-ACP methyl ester carboxylesterase